MYECNEAKKYECNEANIHTSAMKQKIRVQWSKYTYECNEAKKYECNEANIHTSAMKQNRRGFGTIFFVKWWKTLSTGAIKQIW